MTEPVLVIRDLEIHYDTRPVISGLDLSLHRGDWFCLLGPNGGGKTTLLRAVAGQLAPTKGTIAIDGHSLKEAPSLAKRALGYAHPPEKLPGLLTGRQCLEVYSAAHNLSDVGQPLLRLADAFRLAKALDQLVETYSLGMRQKLSVLLALIGDPALVVLDEAFNGLDPASALILKDELQERVISCRCAVLLATHALDIVLRYATRAGLLLNGTLIRTWTTEELKKIRGGSSSLFERALAQSVEATVGCR